MGQMWPAMGCHVVRGLDVHQTTKQLRGRVTDNMLQLLLLLAILLVHQVAPLAATH